MRLLLQYLAKLLGMFKVKKVAVLYRLPSGVGEKAMMMKSH